MNSPDQIQPYQKERRRRTTGVVAVIAAAALAGSTSACGAAAENAPRGTTSAVTRVRDSRMHTYRVAADLYVWNTAAPAGELACGQLAESYITEPTQPINGYLGLPLGSIRLRTGADCQGTLGVVFVPAYQAMPDQ